MPYMIAVDVGGTFTDCVVVHEDGKISFGKSPSTPPNFSLGILDAARVTAASMGIDLQSLLKNTRLFFHGSTVATNTMVTRSGAKVGLITTKGFEDTILMMRIKGRFAGRGEEYIKHMVKSDKPQPIVPRPLIKGVIERVDYKGSIIIPLNIETVRQAIKELKDECVDAIAVCLLWSFANPSHEAKIKKLINEMSPETYVSISSELVPKLGEYERMATTVVNSYVGPECNRYLASLEDELKANGLGHSPLIMQAHGGCLPVGSAVERPVGMIGSGPVGGLIGAKYIAELLGYRNVITTDVGGTTFDVGLIYQGEPELAREASISQYSLLIPTIEITSIGAGGGSIIWVEPVTNLLKVGPRSAGATPGPVCYDKGGTEPTITDANLILGYLNEDYFLGGKIRLNKDKAVQTFKTRIAEPLGISVEEAAFGAYEIVNSHMADLVRSITVGRGRDPRACALLAFGGAGPIHAEEYGREAMAIVIPYTASVHSAMGIATSDVIHAYEVAEPMNVPANVDACNAAFERLERTAREELLKEGFDEAEIELSRYVDMRYMRQVFEVRTPVPARTLSEKDLDEVYVNFEELYEKSYGKGSAYKEAGMQLVTFAVYGNGKIRKPLLTKSESVLEDALPALKGRRAVFSKEQKAFIPTDIYDFDRMKSGAVVNGPAIIETPVTTIVVSSDRKAVVDEYRNVLLRLREE
jgi:N-methylhydantoinase A